MGCCFSSRGSDDQQEIEINFNSLHSNGKKKSGGKRKEDKGEEDQILNQCQLGLKSSHLQIQENQIITGSGTILGSCPLDCDTARWEIHIVDGITSTDQIQIGIKRFYKHVPAEHLNRTLEQANQANSSQTTNETISYYLSDQSLVLKENDVIGVYWDLTDLPMLQFTLNGELLASASINRIRPSNDMYVAVSLDGSKATRGKFKVVFNDKDFRYPAIASKFRMIICSTKLI